MTATNKPVLGTRNCPDCGRPATIHQAGGRRGSLYQRCGCGCVQSSGRLVQSRMWHETEWRAGLKPVQLPANVAEEGEYRELLAAAKARGSFVPSRELVKFEVHGGPVYDQTDRAITEAPAAAAPGQSTDYTPVQTPVSEPGAPVKKASKKGWIIALLAGLAIACAAVARSAKVPT